MYASELSETRAPDRAPDGAAGGSLPETRGHRGAAAAICAAGARILEGLRHAFLLQRGGLIHWVPVCLAVGIGAWFALPTEPGMPAYGALVAAGLLCLAASRLAGEAFAPLLIACALASAGALIAGARAHTVAAPVLEFRYYGPIEGRIVGMDRSASGAPRLTLDRVRLEDVAPARTPARVRLSLHGTQDWITPHPGLTIMLTGHLSPPGGPVEPGGFDFARKAWFDRLGAVGYTRTPVLMAAPPERSAALVVFRVRMALSAAVQAALPGERGAFAAAILTGDRSAIPPDALEDLRGANLAHLLAISGLHMGLLTGVVFASLRGGLALVPYAALRVPGKKIAAGAALAAGAVYLALSGGNVATVRAYIMVSVILVAVLLDRRAISLRSVAIAATIVLILTPEALSGPGFQMSFAATVALVAAFGAVRKWQGPRVPRWAAPVGVLFLSSAVAGLATAPFAAAHFNRFTDYGLIANLLSVPLMGALVMPAAVAAVVLAPLGLAWWALQAMGLGLAWILWVADWVTALEGALTPIVAPGPAVLPLLSFGALVLILWRGGARWLGLLPCAAALWLWVTVERPAILISESGGLIGVLGPEGRALSKARGEGFSAEVWLENDGDLASQAAAAERPGLSGAPGDRRVALGDWTLVHLTGRGRLDRVAGACGADLVVLNAELATPPDRGCTILDTRALRETGSLAIWARTDGPPRIVAARDPDARRLWSAR
ncbi:MAG: ComEC/Rec2 family competence protein [Pseudomonadota bacterium]